VEEHPVPEPADVLAAEAADRLVSENPAINSVSSLSALAAAVDIHRRAVDPSIGPRTIEDLVKDVMRPMIREWLDDNLPSLVERVVGREIERMTREAEDISQR
jgi:cell pole-organizing protein PopZ